MNHFDHVEFLRDFCRETGALARERLFGVCGIKLVGTCYSFRPRMQ